MQRFSRVGMQTRVGLNLQLNHRIVVWLVFVCCASGEWIKRSECRDLVQTLAAVRMNRLVSIPSQSGVYWQGFSSICVRMFTHLESLAIHASHTQPEIGVYRSLGSPWLTEMIETLVFAFAITFSHQKTASDYKQEWQCSLVGLMCEQTLKSGALLISNHKNSVNLYNLQFIQNIFSQSIGHKQ